MAKVKSSDFSWCKEVGLLKRNYSEQTALKDFAALARENFKDVEPTYVAQLEALKVGDIPLNVSVTPMYRYTVELDFVLNDGGRQKTFHKSIDDFGYSGVNDSLHINEYKGEGNYTVLAQASDCPYEIYVTNSIFTKDEMINAVKKKLEKDYLPSNWIKYNITSLVVSAYLVPILSMSYTFEGKEYVFLYNLHNGWHWTSGHPIAHAIEDKAKKFKKTGLIMRLASLGISVLGLVLGLKGAVLAKIVGIAGLIFNLWKQKDIGKRPYNDFLKIVKKNPKVGVTKACKQETKQCIFAVIFMIAAAIL